MSVDSVGVARQAVELARDGKFAQLTELFADGMRQFVPADALAASWQGVAAQLGEISDVGEAAVEDGGGGATVVRLALTAANGQAAALVSVNAEGRLTGLQIAPASAATPPPAWVAPAYADEEALTERDVTLTVGGLEVPGTLTLPVEPNGAAVVLAAGSGPCDRDETVGACKPFKDLAWGLATRGITVLRFDKVTHACRAAVMANRAFTLTDEYIHALAAFDLLAAEPSVDPARIVLAGHSMGGTAGPRLVQLQRPESGHFAGLILLAGGAVPLQHTMVRQVRYLLSLAPDAAASQRSSLELLQRQAEAVDSPDLSAQTPDADLPGGTPAAYWLDLRGYDPAATAAKLDIPILVLQGGRDYQVTVEDDLPLWRAALDGRPGVSIEVFPADDHLFVPGEGPSTPADYEVPGHVDPAVIGAMSNWIAQR